MAGRREKGGKRRKRKDVLYNNTSSFRSPEEESYMLSYKEFNLPLKDGRMR